MIITFDIKKSLFLMLYFVIVVTKILRFQMEILTWHLFIVIL